MTPLDLIGRTVACPTTGCWLWTGATSGDPSPGVTGRGYPRIKYRGYTVAVHRLILQLSGVRLRPKQQVDHKCRNRLCIRPEHLEPVTHRVNMQRRDRAGRMLCS